MGWCLARQKGGSRGMDQPHALGETMRNTVVEAWV